MTVLQQWQQLLRNTLVSRGGWAHELQVGESKLIRLKALSESTPAVAWPVRLTGLLRASVQLPPGARAP